MIQSSADRIDIPARDLHGDPVVPDWRPLASIGSEAFDPMQSLRVTSGLAIATCSALLPVAPAAYSQTTMSQPSPIERNADREIYNTLPGESNKKGSVLDVTNPMELMRSLRQANSMNDATDPVDAIDEALREFSQP